MKIKSDKKILYLYELSENDIYIKKIEIDCDNINYMEIVIGYDIILKIYQKKIIDENLLRDYYYNIIPLKNIKYQNIYLRVVCDGEYRGIILDYEEIDSNLKGLIKIRNEYQKPNILNINSGFGYILYK